MLGGVVNARTNGVRLLTYRLPEWRRTRPRELRNSPNGACFGALRPHSIIGPDEQVEIDGQSQDGFLGQIEGPFCLPARGGSHRKRGDPHSFHQDDWIFHFNGGPDRS